MSSFEARARRNSYRSASSDPIISPGRDMVKALASASSPSQSNFPTYRTHLNDPSKLGFQPATVDFVSDEIFDYNLELLASNCRRLYKWHWHPNTNTTPHLPPEPTSPRVHRRAPQSWRVEDHPLLRIRYVRLCWPMHRVGEGPLKSSPSFYPAAPHATRRLTHGYLHFWHFWDLEFEKWGSVVAQRAASIPVEVLALQRAFRWAYVRLKI